MKVDLKRKKGENMEKPTIYLLAQEPYKNADLALIERIQGLVCVATLETLEKAGFREIQASETNRWWSFLEDISLTEYQKTKKGTRPYRHPVSLNLMIRQTPEGVFYLDEVGVIDEMFGQPHFTNEEYNEKIFAKLDRLMEQGVFKLVKAVKTQVEEA